MYKMQDMSKYKQQGVQGGPDGAGQMGIPPGGAKGVPGGLMGVPPDGPKLPQ
jgi:hypothetical protein